MPIIKLTQLAVPGKGYCKLEPDSLGGSETVANGTFHGSTPSLIAMMQGRQRNRANPHNTNNPNNPPKNKTGESTDADCMETRKGISGPSLANCNMLKLLFMT